MRTIIHSDLNKFYASVEQAEDPSLRGRPVVVGGDEAARHGVALAVSAEAKALGIATAMTLWEIRHRWPDATVVPARLALYGEYGRRARAIYGDYTDLVEPFGPDEAWLDITDSAHLHGGDAILIASEISERVKAELGLTVSVGLSWSKTLAKFASDSDPGDGLRVIGPADLARGFWTAPVSCLPGVGPATTIRLVQGGITTIGDLAHAPDPLLQALLGRVGLLLKVHAQGLDDDPVVPPAQGTERGGPIKSLGHRLTAPFDLADLDETRQLLWMAAAEPCRRLRELGLAAQGVEVWVKEAGSLGTWTHRALLDEPTDGTATVSHRAAALLEEGWTARGRRPLRAVGVRVFRLRAPTSQGRFSMVGERWDQGTEAVLDRTRDAIRERFGPGALRSMREVARPELLVAEGEGTPSVHPPGPRPL